MHMNFRASPVLPVQGRPLSWPLKVPSQCAFILAAYPSDSVRSVCPVNLFMETLGGWGCLSNKDLLCWKSPQGLLIPSSTLQVCCLGRLVGWVGGVGMWQGATRNRTHPLPPPPPSSACQQLNLGIVMFRLQNLLEILNNFHSPWAPLMVIVLNCDAK